MTRSLESAIEDLRLTIELALTCEEQPHTFAKVLNSHLLDIEEDYDALNSIQVTDPEELAQKETALREARCAKRALSKSALALTELESAAASARSQALTSAPVSTESTSKNNLQKLKLPVFSGEPSRFRAFYDLYIENVEDDKSISAMAKWAHLDRSLAGEAAQLVSKIPRLPNMRETALKLLKDTYDNHDRALADLFTQLNTLPPATLDDKSLRMTQGQIEGLLLSLEAMGHIVNNDVNLKNQVTSKFPKEFMYLVIPSAPENDLAKIRIRLHDIISAREAVGHCSAAATSNASQTVTRTNAPPITRRNNQPIRPLKCVFCGGPHWSDDCTVYVDIPSRLARIPDRCARCLRLKHDGPCTTSRRCAYCDDPTHNRAFCPKKFPAKSETQLFTVSQQQQHPTGGAYLTFLINVSGPDNIPKQMRAVIDTAAGKSCITNRAAQTLNLCPNKSLPISFAGLNGTALQTGVLATTELMLLPPQHARIDIPIYITNDIAADLPAADVLAFKQQHPQWAHLDIPPTGENNTVDIILASDALPQIVLLDRGVIIDKNTQLLATKFGYLIMGHRSQPRTTKPEYQLFFTQHPDHLIKQMWELDALGLKELESTDVNKEEEALRKFYETITFTNHRYEVGWPFLERTPPLSDNFGLAWGRLKSLWKKLASDRTLLQQCNEIIHKQIIEEIVEPIPENNQEKPIRLHYLPHHPVVRAESTSTKVRLVYDASAKTSKKSCSLNESLHVGTRWVGDIFGHLLRFRKFETGIVADISQAFLQIAIRETDRDVVRFLWLKDPFRPPTYDNLLLLRFRRLAFGIASSPFLLFATISHHLKTRHPEQEQLVLENLYADNVVASLPSSSPPFTFYTDIRHIFEDMSMQMMKWASNNTQLTKAIPSEHRNDELIQSVLGLKWNTKTDTLSLRAPHLKRTPGSQLTKRQVLSQTAAVYDPLGWATPVVLKARLFIRKLWAHKTEWDETLHITMANEWNLILHDLEAVHTITRDRKLFANLPDDEIEQLYIHTFVDASADATAVVIYATAKTKMQTQTTLLAARSRLTPATKLSIPRLELLALLLGTKFTNYTIQALKWKIQPSIFIWSDSACVLAWINNEKLLPAIIARQVAQIKQLESAHFRHVPSNMNSADIASRGSTVQELHRIKWWDGPTWLNNENDWPSSQIPETTPPNLLLFTRETPATETVTNQRTTLLGLQPEQFSSLAALYRRSAYVCKAINLLMRKPALPLQASLDYKYVEYLWIKWDQHNNYASLFNSPQQQKKLHRLRYYVDESEIIRCQTRLQKAALPDSAITPILLAKGTELTKLIIMEIHVKNGHAGAPQTLAILRQRYWLPQGRREVQRTIKEKCFRCRRYNTQQFAVPPPSPLPEFRIQQACRPFETIGVDIFGPFWNRTSNVRKAPKIKKWVLIFTCAVVRAVHLETIAELTTTAILEAFRRFFARRGTPTTIISDNAPQFHTLNGKFQDIWRTLEKESQISSYFAAQTIVWKFITPNSPWMGGMYERLIATVKTALDKTYGLLCLLERQFDTSIIEIEAILNQRPLTYVEKSLDSPVVTPMDFLNAKFPAVPLHNLPLQTDELLTLWRSSQNHLNTFWTHWSQHFLLALRDRNDQRKQAAKSTPSLPEPEDIVLITEPETKRSTWRLAVVEVLIYSEDNQCRSVLVRLSDGTKVIKPLTKLAPMHLNTRQPATDTPLAANRQVFVVDEREGAVLAHSNEPTQTAVDDAEEVIEYEIEISDWEDDENPENNNSSQGTSS